MTTKMKKINKFDSKTHKILYLFKKFTHIKCLWTIKQLFMYKLKDSKLKNVLFDRTKNQIKHQITLLLRFITEFN